jgi:site-specific recombinase XerD
VAGATGVDLAWHAHNLRHQFASEEAAGGANMADLAETLGHQSPGRDVPPLRPQHARPP